MMISFFLFCFLNYGQLGTVKTHLETVIIRICVHLLGVHVEMSTLIVQRISLSTIDACIPVVLGMLHTTKPGSQVESSRENDIKI